MVSRFRGVEIRKLGLQIWVFFLGTLGWSFGNIKEMWNIHNLESMKDSSQRLVKMRYLFWNLCVFLLSTYDPYGGILLRDASQNGIFGIHDYIAISFQQLLVNTFPKKGKFYNLIRSFQKKIQITHVQITPRKHKKALRTPTVNCLGKKGNSLIWRSVVHPYLRIHVTCRACISY